MRRGVRGRQDRAAVTSYLGGRGPPQPASQKVPRTPGQVPERQGRRLEGIIGSCLSSSRPGGRAGRGKGVGCMRE